MTPPVPKSEHCPNPTRHEPHTLMVGNQLYRCEGEGKSPGGSNTNPHQVWAAAAIFISIVIAFTIISLALIAA